MRKNNKLVLNELASLGIQILQKRTTIDDVVTKHKIPYWQMTEVLVSLVQNSYNSITISPEADLGVFSKRYGNDENLKPICFLHIMKTAGTTLTSYLTDFYLSEEICSVGSTEELEKIAMETNLRKFSLITGHVKLSWMLANGFEYKDINYITFLRHPVSRQLSFYQHCMRALKQAPYNDLMHVNNEQCLTLTSLKLRSGYATMKEHLEAAKEVLERLFFVGVQERFDEGLYSLSRLLGNPLSSEPSAIKSVKLNTKSNNQNEVFPQKIIDEIMSNNWADLELHAYATDLFKRKFSNDAMVNMPKQNFTEIKPQSKILYTMDQPIRGSGWHFREGSKSIEPGIWRWTGPKSESTLIFHVTPNITYKLSIKVINYLAVEIFDGLKIFVNDKPISYEKAYPETGGIIVSGRIEENTISEKLKPNLVLRFEVPKVIKFKDVVNISDDDRMCGIAITNVDIIPEMAV